MAGYIPNEHVCRELEAIKKAKEDQALWDDVAKEMMTEAIHRPDLHNYQQYASFSFNCADAFMAERAKRMELVIREGQK